MSELDTSLQDEEIAVDARFADIAEGHRSLSDAVMSRSIFFT